MLPQTGSRNAATCGEVERLGTANGKSHEALRSRGMDRFCKPRGPHHREGKDERTFGARVQALLKNSLSSAAGEAGSGDRSELHAARRRCSNRQDVLCGFEFSGGAETARAWQSCSSTVFYGPHLKALDHRAFEQDKCSIARTPFRLIC